LECDAAAIQRPGCSRARSPHFPAPETNPPRTRTHFNVRTRYERDRGGIPFFFDSLAVSIDRGTSRDGSFVTRRRRIIPFHSIRGETFCLSARARRRRRCRPARNWCSTTTARCGMMGNLPGRVRMHVAFVCTSRSTRGNLQRTHWMVSAARAGWMRSAAEDARATNARGRGWTLGRSSTVDGKFFHRLGATTERAFERAGSRDARVRRRAPRASALGAWRRYPVFQDCMGIQSDRCDLEEIPHTAQNKKTDPTRIVVFSLVTNSSVKEKNGAHEV
jgi:hypothetical protein